MSIIQDISRYQPSVDFAYLKSKGQNHIIIKLASGSLFVDPKFYQHYGNARTESFTVSPYVWADPITNALTQSKFFLESIDGKTISYVVIDFEQWWLDWEKYYAWRRGEIPESSVPRATPEQLLNLLKTVYEFLYNNCRYNILIYTANWFIREYCPIAFEYLKDKPTYWADYSLFKATSEVKTWEQLEALAPVGKRIPTLPADYPMDYVMMWQWSGDQFTAKGVYANESRTALSKLDLNLWLKTEQDFINFSKERPMAAVLYYPVDRGFRISQYFGENADSSAYQVSGGHNGIDWALPVGSNIYASQDGEVIRAEEVTYGYGRHIRIKSADGITIYGHLSSLKVKVGDKVIAKQVIGLSGGATSDPFSGYSTGPHLHFEYRPDAGAPKVAGGLAGAANPLPLLVSHNYPNPDPIMPVLFKAKCTVASLNVREAPNTTARVVDGLGFNEVVSVYEVSANNWYRIDPYVSKWCSGTYMEKIDTAPTPPAPTPVTKTILVKTVVASSLRVRKSPSLSATIVDIMPKGQLVEVLETKGDWIRVGYNQWCLTKYGGITYIE